MLTPVTPPPHGAQWSCLNLGVLLKSLNFRSLGVWIKKKRLCFNLGWFRKPIFGHVLPQVAQRGIHVSRSAVFVCLSVCPWTTFQKELFSIFTIKIILFPPKRLALIHFFYISGCFKPFWVLLRWRLKFPAPKKCQVLLHFFQRVIFFFPINFSKQQN